MACDISALLPEAKCFFCNFQGDMALAAEIVLLCALRNGETIDCSANAILREANCLLCQVPPGMLPAIKLAVLCHVVNGT